MSATKKKYSRKQEKIMENSIGFLILSKMFGFNPNQDTDKCRDLLEKAIKGNKDVTKQLAELIGCDEASVEKAINSLRETVAKQAKENGVSVETMFDMMNQK